MASQIGGEYHHAGPGKARMSTNVRGRLADVWRLWSQNELGLEALTLGLIADDASL